MLVSVIIPAFNAECWLSHTIKSAAAQTLREIEILVVDDGSSDGTATLVRRHAEADPRVRLIRQANGGVGAARNAGIREARGKFIAPLDADDLWHPRKLELQVSRAEAAGEETALIYCWSGKVDADGRSHSGHFATTLEGRVLRSVILTNFVGNASVPLIRARALETTGLYLERDGQDGAQGCEDWDLSVRLAEHFQFALVPDVLVSYRQRNDCMSLNIRPMSRSFKTVMRRARERNPSLPGRVFRWSSGNFHGYLVSKCFMWADYRGCLFATATALTADPVLLTHRKYYLMALKSICRLITGTRIRKPFPETSPATPRRAIWSDHLRTRRTRLVFNEDLSQR